MCNAHIKFCQGNNHLFLNHVSLGCGSIFVPKGLRRNIYWKWSVAEFRWMGSGIALGATVSRQSGCRVICPKIKRLSKECVRKSSVFFTYHKIWWGKKVFLEIWVGLRPREKTDGLWPQPRQRTLESRGLTIHSVKGFEGKEGRRVTVAEGLHLLGRKASTGYSSPLPPATFPHPFDCRLRRAHCIKDVSKYMCNHELSLCFTLIPLHERRILKRKSIFVK